MAGKGEVTADPVDPRRTGESLRFRRAFLERLPLFAGLPSEDLARICRLASEVEAPSGTLIMEEGAPGDALFIVVAGEVEVTKREDGGPREVVLATRGPGEFLGEMALLEQAPHMANVRARSHVRLLRVEGAQFQELLSRRPSTATTLLRTVAARLRSTEASLMQREKLASLGTLAAGLAHELNNPAAALSRGAAHLKDAFRRWDRRAEALGTLAFTPEQAACLQELKEAVEACGPPNADAVACSLEEAALGDWLGAHGLPEGHEIAPPLVAFGFGRARVEMLAEAFDPDQLPGVLAWLSAGFEARALLSEIGVSARVISEIVTAVKRYAYLDEAPVQEVDLEESLETTLIILRHKLREGVEVRRDYGTSPPTIEAHGSELTQVWTNLIDNAVEAMGGKGTLEIRIRPGPGSPGPDFVEVEVEDSGPGIPESIRSRIFDPFFTTKGPGSGSGLGLHIVYNTVVDRHRGRVAVESEPGRTLFRVTLPLRLTLDRP